MKSAIMRITLFSVLLFTLVISSASSAAEKRRVDVKPKITSQPTEHRIALVIGNANYRIGPLRNPANDARAIAAALRDLGFDVDEQINLSYQDMGRAVNRFGKAIRRDSVALFYYAGHGLQVQGSNYLVPVDMEIQDEGEVQFNTVNAGQVLAKMEEAKNPVNIVILDACRDNPYAKGWKRTSLSRGLASMDAPVGSFVAYAAAPGKTADDGRGENGLYTESLVRQIKNPGMKIEDIFKRVRTEVRSKSNGTQVPEERSSLEGDFYFARGSMVVEEPPAPSAVREPETGKITVRSNVGGARVYINRTDRGIEPVSATLNPGEYSITLKKEGYSDAFDTVRVEAGSAKTISIVMEKPAPPPMIEPPRPATANIDNTFTSPILGTTFVLIPAGSFLMGSPNGESGDRDETQHQITISRPFYMQTTEVTQGQWQKVMGYNPSRFSSCGNDCPVEQVSWNDVQEFIGKLNGMERTDRYRLPTEAQWEYAARARTTTPFNTGNSCLETHQANYDGSYPLSGCSKGEYRQKTVQVGSFAPNAWGLYDMHGNVMEWVHDLKGDYHAASVTDPEGPAWGTHRVIRGGSWDNLPSDCRSARRVNFVPGSRSSLQGFRLLSTVAVSDSPSIEKPALVSGAIDTGRDGRFIANSNGTVLDTKTNLMWAAKDNASESNWANAKSYCENYRGGGYSDWRMPTQDELAGLYDSTKTYRPPQKYYDIHLTKLIQLSACCPWAETHGSDTASFDFITGARRLFPEYYNHSLRALPVRFGK